MSSHREKRGQRLPWIIAAVLVLLLLILIGIGWWRSSGVGPQVQVPMFYDAHYLFPRAWTQEQVAPGVPEPAPLAFFGPNRISQTFISGSDQLSMIELWLAGQENETVAVSLVNDHGESVSGKILLSEGLEGANYHLSFEPFEKAKENRFTVTMTAPNATIEKPVVTRTIGGDRLGGSLNINEYNRPGNLQLTTYASGLPGIWWLKAVGEQILPSTFGLRLQQYKSSIFKGAIFSLLLLITAGLSILYLVLARPQATTSFDQLSKVLGWTVVLVLSLFLFWQLVDGRVMAKPFIKSNALDDGDNVIAKVPPPGSPPRLMNDLVAGLWTAERYPEERFVRSGTLTYLPAIQVPADSRLEYNIDGPPNAWFRTGFVGEGVGELRAEVSIGTESIHSEKVTSVTVPGSEDITWIELDLAPWAGDPVSLILETEGEVGAVDGWWVMPQIATGSDWVLADPMPAEIDIEAVSYRFGDEIELLGYRVMPSPLDEGESAQVNLYWRPLQESGTFGKVFVHLVDEQGQLVAQDDGQPVNNAYPIPFWQPGTIILDAHMLQLPADFDGGMYTLAVGLYDPDSLQRWQVKGEDGQIVADGRVVLTTAFEVTP